MAVRKLVFVGAGAIGGSVAAWTAETRSEVYCYDRKEVLDAIEAGGIRHYDGALGPASGKAVKVGVVRDLSVLDAEDVLVFCVKNFSLDAVAAEVSRATGGRPLALSLANGLENQTVLPRHFSRCAYGVVGYNAWLDAPGVVGWQNRGPLVIGVTDPALSEIAAELAAVFAEGMEAEATDRLGDAAHSKLVVNLVNTISTLVGQGYRPITDIASMQRLVSRTLYEGVRVVVAAGYREYHVGAMPRFSKIRAAATLPAFVTRGLFEKSLAQMVRSSMSQDVILRGGTETELDTLTGYIVSLAERVGMAAPYNAALYRIAKDAFSKPGFTPVEPRALLEAVEGGADL